MMENNSNSYFDGGLFQLIGWRILGGIVTLITLGICFPWSFCMIYRWEAKHTVIEGKRLYFDGTALQLFGSWIKWFFLTLITLGIYGLWLPIKFKKWKIKHTRYMYKEKPAQVISNNQNTISKHINNPTNTISKPVKQSVNNTINETTSNQVSEKNENDIINSSIDGFNW